MATAMVPPTPKYPLRVREPTRSHGSQNRLCRRHPHVPLLLFLAPHHIPRPTLVNAQRPILVTDALGMPIHHRLETTHAGNLTIHIGRWWWTKIRGRGHGHQLLIGSLTEIGTGIPIDCETESAKGREKEKEKEIACHGAMVVIVEAGVG
jgi:hypothetical protein